MTDLALTDVSWSIFIQSASILLREGLEVILVLGALVAYLVKSGAGSRLSALYTGAALGVVASFGFAFLIEAVFGEAESKIFEGVSMLVAAGLMVYVSGWLFVRQDPRAWQAYLRTHADGALAATNVGLSVGILAFFSVIREGAETVVFYHALSNSVGGWSSSLLAGFAVSALALAILFGVMRVVSVRLPLRPLFIVTSAFLFVMAFQFVGDGLHEFQEANLLSESDINLPHLLAGIGFQETLEALGAQLVLLIGVVATFAMLHFRGSSTPAIAGR